MNPYAADLGLQEPLVVIGATAPKLQSLVARIHPDRLRRPMAPGKWSVRDVLCHLADTEIGFAFRLRQALAEPHHVIQPFDQDGWARMYAAYDAPAAIAVFSALRAWDVALLRAVPPEEFSRPVTHPERGEMTFRTIVETMAGHDLHHLEQLESFARQESEAT